MKQIEAPSGSVTCKQYFIRFGETWYEWRAYGDEEPQYFGVASLWVLKQPEPNWVVRDLLVPDHDRRIQPRKHAKAR